MAVELIDVKKCRESAEKELKLERAIQSKKIAKAADLEVAPAFSVRRIPGASSAPAPQEYRYVEYMSGLHQLICKGADHAIAGKGNVEQELNVSEDVRHGLTELLGGGTTSPYLGLAGAVGSIMLRHVGLRSIGASESEA